MQAETRNDKLWQLERGSTLLRWREQEEHYISSPESQHIWIIRHNFVQNLLWLPVRKVWSQPRMGPFLLLSFSLQLQNSANKCYYFTSVFSNLEIKTLTRESAPSGSQVEMDRHTLFKLPLRVEGVVRRHSQQPDDAVQVSEISSSSALKNTTKASSLHISMESMIHLSESGHNQPWINRLIWSSGKSLKVL